MHLIEPYYAWRHLYIASEDQHSPFYGNEYSEFEFTHAIYDHYIHPQWDEFGSATLYIKILFVNYDTGCAILELFGEWNDCLYNDIMFLKRNIIEALAENGVNQFILIGDNILNFHASEDDYYQEWREENEGGWIAGINFRPHVVEEFVRAGIDNCICMGGALNDVAWRSLMPMQLFDLVNQSLTRRLRD